MYFHFVNYSERGCRGKYEHHQLILHQSSKWFKRIEDFYIPTIMTHGFYHSSDREHQQKIRSYNEPIPKISKSLARWFSS